MSVLGTVGNVAGDLGKGIAGTLEAFSKDAIQLRDDAFQRKREQQQMEFESALKGMQDDVIALQQAREAGDVGKVNDISRRMGIRKEAIDKLTSGNKDVQGAWQQTLQQLGKHLRKPVPPPQAQPGMMAQQALPLPQFGASQYADVLSGGFTPNQQGDIDQQNAQRVIREQVAQKQMSEEDAQRYMNQYVIEKRLGLKQMGRQTTLKGITRQGTDPSTGKPWTGSWDFTVMPDGTERWDRIAEKPTGALRNRMDAERIAADPEASEADKKAAASFLADEEAKTQNIKFGPGVLGQMRRSQAILADPKASQADKAAARAFFEERKASLEAKIQSTQGALDTNTVEFAASMYRATGTMPALGLGGTALRSKILAAAARQSSAAGQSPEELAANQAYYHAERGAAGRLEGQRALTESFATTADANLDLAVKLGKEVGRSGSPALNRVLLKFKGQYAGDEDTLAFESAVQVAANEYAKVITGQTSGAAVSDAARRETQTLLSATYSQSAFEAVVKVMKQEMERRRQGFAKGAEEIRGRLAKPETATKPTGTPGAAPATPGAPKTGADYLKSIGVPQ